MRRTVRSRATTPALARRVVGSGVWEAKTLLAEHPSVSVPLARLRRRGRLVDPETDVLIEGFVRSGLSFAVAAFRLAQEPDAVNVAHHTHAPGSVLAALRMRVPAIVLVRAPEDAVLSYIIKTSDVSIGSALRGYVRFHRPLVGHLGRFVVGTFDEVVSDFGQVIARVNVRYAKSFRLFEPSPANVSRCFREIDEDWRVRGRSPEARERGVPRPSAVRARLKAAMRAGYLDPRLDALRIEAEEVFGMFAAAADGSGEPTRRGRDRTEP